MRLSITLKVPGDERKQVLACLFKQAAENQKPLAVLLGRVGVRENIPNHHNKVKRPKPWHI